jgi:threonine dehydrogenase-like Zn-dependent dehydrogenase
MRGGASVDTRKRINVFQIASVLGSRENVHNSPLAAAGHGPRRAAAERGIDMRAAIFSDGTFKTQTIPSPLPGPGQMLVRPLVCGICGSDLHTRHHAHNLANLLQRAGFAGFMNPDLPVVLGHEFCCEILDYGPDCERRVPVGERVVGLPFMSGPKGIVLLGYSNEFNGAFAEQMVLQENATFAVPDHVPTDVAALAEPLAVAVHAVAAAAPGPDCAFVVYGCGPVGLFVIARLRHLGLGPVLAIDPDAARRRFAEQIGADVVTAPSPEFVGAWWDKRGAPLGVSDAAAARAAGLVGRRPIIFECVGKPGVLKSIAEEAPAGASMIVVGVCMTSDTIEPAYLIQKQISLRFVFAYDAEEFAEATRMLAKDPSRVAILVTGHETLDGVANAFDLLERGGSQAKVLVRPT